MSKEPFQSKSPYSGKPRKVELKSITTDDLGLYIDGERFLAQGEELTIRGILKEGMKKPMLDSVVIKATSNARLRGILRLTLFEF